VADGVGGWRDVGVDSGVYARLLMHYVAEELASCEAAEEAAGAAAGDAAAHRALPLQALVQAHKRTRVPGGSTALVVVLRSRSLWAANLGDSGFLVLRDGGVLYRAPQQQHEFNFPFQLSSRRGADMPTDAQLHEVAVQPGDIVVAATDGLWDNLWDVEVARLVSSAITTGRGVAGAAADVALAGHRRGFDRTARTPFSEGAKQAGWKGWQGGKPDDCMVVVAEVMEGD
jgi:protein phosphatase PTC7